MRAAPQSTALRVIVVLVGVYLVGFGLWAFLSPSSSASIAAFLPYNQHFVHDIGAFQVGLGMTLLLTQLWGDALLVVLAGNAVGATIHVAAHVIDRSLGGRPAIDIAFLGGLALLLVAGSALRYRQVRKLYSKGAARS